MFKHICIATDGSRVSEKALDQALAFARDAGAAVTIVSVVKPTVSFRADNSLAESYGKEVEQELDRRLDAAVQSAKALGVKADKALVVHAHTHLAIAETAQSRGCDLIAMGSHGRTGLEGFFVGSEVQRVLTSATMPVLVFK